MNWVKCSERMPPDGRMVLAHFPGGLIHTAVRSREPGFEKSRWFCDVVTRMGMQPTHWTDYEPPSREGGRS